MLLQANISNFQWAVAIAVVPVCSLATALILYVANNRSGKMRAEEIKQDLSEKIVALRTDLNLHRNELRDEIGKVEARVNENISRTREELSTNINRVESGLEKQIQAVKEDLGHSIQTVKSDLRDGIRSDMESALAKLQLDIERRQTRSSGSAGAVGD